MRSPALHDALAAFAAEAADRLAADAAAGAEIPFELVEQPGARSSLAFYRPLTSEFIHQRVAVLGRLPSYGRAAAALQRQAGLETYLQARGEPRVPPGRGERADAALRSFLSRLFEGTSEFVLDDGRFTRAYAELEAMVYEERVLTTVVAVVHGVELASGTVELGDGLSLARGDAIADAPAEAVWPGGAAAAEPATLVVLEREGEPGDGAPVSAARVRFHRLLAALRLYDRGDVALGPGAWVRLDDGPWRLVALGGGGRPGSAAFAVAAEQEDELRAFCSLVARRAPAGGEAAWALARFEMGCERLAPFEALTDHLLALRALLEPEGPSSGRMAQRLAALCALPDERPALAERVAHAVSLERAVIAGIAPAAPDADGIVAEIADHLRALLRDVVCGHLDADLVTVADGILGLGEPAEDPADVTPPAGFVAVPAPDAPSRAPALW